VLGTGAGEIVERFEPLEQHAVLVLPLPHALSTADVYRAADQLGLSRSSEDLGPRYDELVAALNPGARPLERLLVNDLEPAALSLHPDIHAAITATREAGADRSLVCGSGPTVVGLFWGREDDGAAARARAEAAAEALVGRYPRVFVAVPVDPAFGAARRVA
jgi:4-diphosphocytidyl-2-C-methyl-D-erythritol kinase